MDDRYYCTSSLAANIPFRLAYSYSVISCVLPERRIWVNDKMIGSNEGEPRYPKWQQPFYWFGEVMDFLRSCDVCDSQLATSQIIGRHFTSSVSMTSLMQNNLSSLSWKGYKLYTDCREIEKNRWFYVIRVENIWNHSTCKFALMSWQSVWSDFEWGRWSLHKSARSSEAMCDPVSSLPPAASQKCFTSATIT